MTGLWHYLHDNWVEIRGLLWTTIWLAVVPVVVGLAIALPIGWVANRYRVTYPPIATGAGLLYTIPSLILFLIMPGLIGTKILDPLNVAIGLTLYTVALLVRIVADGLASVAPVTLAAAAAMGYTARQQFFAVQLPVAIPVIGAGLRVAAVSNVSLISVASIIGVAQLGSLFVEGNSRGVLTPIVVGLILFVALALVFDAVILVGVRLLTPWRRAVA